jgi:autotransporter strand-loop-strand O-heptosyltransferase
MKKQKIFLHGSYIGTTGYNNHTRDFVRHLSNLIDIKVRNFTIGKSWNGLSDTPHDNETYFNDTDRKVLYEQILRNTDKSLSNFKIYKDESKEFIPDVNIVLCETNHHLFYENYDGPRIAYNVWESTLQPTDFFERLKYFDEFWVPSKWQKECTIKQGYPEEKIKVVPEGVDVHTFYPEEINCEYTNDNRFKFFLAGRWDYRKSTKEIIESFLKTFSEDEPVDLIVSIDNPFSNDGLNSTEERLEYYGFTDKRIKVLHFPPREDYIKLLKSSNVFLSCARSEGWNLPLIEAMSCGTPSIYSNCSGQLEFAEGKGLPVKISHEKLVSDSTYNHFNNSIGNYYEPDFDDLCKVMRDSYENYTTHKEKTLIDSKDIRKNFSWENVAKIGLETINNFMSRKPWENRPIKKNVINVSYINGPKVEILGDEDMEYFIEFIDSNTNEVIHSTTIKNNMWTTCGRKYYTKWVIKINDEIYSSFDVEGKRVLVSLDSSSIGDTIAWTPYAVEFSKKHNCKVILSTFHNDWFKNNPTYKDIEFINPGQSTPCYASYTIGWFRNKDSNKWDNLSLNPIPPNTQSLQKTATDILGLDFKELNLGINFKPTEKPPYINKYVVICPESTAGCKEWTYDSWVKLSEMLKKLGYSVVTLTKKKYNIKGNINIYKRSLDESINLLYHAQFMVGISSGLSWLNWSLGKHTFLISGFTPKNHEFTTNITRIINEHSCNSCWSSTNFSFDAGDWNWCPIWKGTDKQHICQKSITPISVYNEIENYLK